ncbi:MAG: hypothetical protein HKN34_01375 [Gammaproteobacteria bacterium]|nr:hypothetical protein [Gammaproteobacteria bacterium]
MEEKVTMRWIIGVIIGVLAAGGGAVTWIEYFTSNSDNGDAFTWKSLQSNYLETFNIAYTDPSMLAVWPTFEDDSWAGGISDGNYCLSSTIDEEGAQYMFVGLGEENLENTPVSIEVKSKSLPGSTPISAAGLMYRFESSNAYYYAFTVSNQGVVYFYKKNQDGYKVLYTGKSEVFESDRFNKLAVIGRGDSLHLYINDSLEKIIEDKELKSGDPGIVGIGIGKHCFDNFTIYKNIDRLPG